MTSHALSVAPATRLDYHRLRRAELSSPPEQESAAARIAVVTLPTGGGHELEQIISTFLDSLAALGATVSDERSDRPARTSRDVLSLGFIEMDVNRMQVRCDGREVQLRAQEYLLLRAFLTHPDQVLTRSQLLTLAWEHDYAGQGRTVDVHIRRLRVALGDHGDQIKTVRGFGYRLSR